jgi:diguanylate cyclase (GGDEF)-like protein
MSTTRRTSRPYLVTRTPRAPASAPPVAATRLWENVFTPYRKRILYPVAAIGAFVFLPIAVVDFLRGKTLVSAMLACLVAMLVIDAIALYRRRTAPVPFAVLLVPGCAAVTLAFESQGIHGALWSFPLMLLTFFVLPRTLANTVNVALVVAGTALVNVTQDGGTTARFFLSLALCLVVVNIMLSVLDSLHSRLLAQSLTDSLTGAYNRRHMDALVEEAVERKRRTSASVSAILVDIDHFKRINDRYGHDTGDEVLKAVVALMAGRRRKVDQLFRQGGEEFLLLLPDTEAREAMVAADALRKAIAVAPILRDERVTVSIGVGELGAGEDAKDWLKRIDEALYAAKEGGRNRVVSADRAAARRSCYDRSHAPRPNRAHVL